MKEQEVARSFVQLMDFTSAAEEGKRTAVESKVA